MLDHKEQLDDQDQQVQLETLLPMVHQEPQELTVLQENQDQLDFKVSQEPPVSQVSQVSQDTQDDQVHKEHQEPLALQESQDLMVRPDPPDHKESEVHKVPLVRLELKA